MEQWLFFEAAVFFAIIAGMAFRMARLHGMLAELNRLIARMILARDHEAAIHEAETFRHRKGR
jgi:hypothetical protein